MAEGYWARVGKRAWQEAAKSVKLDSRELIMILVFGQIIVGLFLWFALGGDKLPDNLWARAATIGAPFLLFLPLLLTKLLNVPAKMDAELRDELGQLRIPEGGPQPDWRFGQLYAALRGPDGPPWTEALDREIRDKITTGHLEIWAREQRGETFGPLSLIAPSWFMRGDFTHFFLLDDHEGKPHFGGGGPVGDDRRFGDMRVNKAQAMRLWPRLLGS